MRWQQNSIYGKNIYGEIFYIFSISSILPSPDSGRAHKRSQNICCKANNMFELDDLIFLCYVVARERSLFVMRFDCDFNLGTIFLRIAFGCTLWRNAKLETKCFCMQMYTREYTVKRTLNRSRSDWFFTGCIIYLQLNIYRIRLSTWRTQLFLLL